MTSAKLAPEAKIRASIGIAVSRLKASRKILISSPVNSLSGQQSPGCFKNRFVETATEILAANKFRGAGRVPNEGPQNPTDLASQKEIAGQPGQQDVARHRSPVGPLPK